MLFYFVISVVSIIYDFINRCNHKFVLPGADVDLTTDGGRTALHYAASKGRLNIAEKLIAHGAKVNKKDKVCAFSTI